MSEKIYALAPALTLTLSLEESKFGLLPEDLFGVAVRQNDKRPFLFVSKVLGKHLPVDPSVLLAAGKLLALAWTGDSGWEAWSALVKGEVPPPFEQVLARLDGSRHTVEVPTLLIGFAETATGLARAVADAFDGDLRYVSTTRELLPGPEPLTFDEAHSHARTHLLHLDPTDPFWKRCRRAVLVDDEFTTGRTALRLIERLHGAFGIREFVLLTLLDNSTVEERTALEQRLGVRITVTALLQGRILDVKPGPLPAPLPWNPGETAMTGETLAQSALSDDRRPRSAEELYGQREQARALARGLSAGKGDLFLGSGECIYLPALIAGYRGGCHFHSTTQSPVLPMEGSAIVSGARFAPVERYSAAGYLYNVPRNRYARAAVIAEAAMLRPGGLQGLCGHVRTMGVKEVEVLCL